MQSFGFGNALGNAWWRVSPGHAGRLGAQLDRYAKSVASEGRRREDARLKASLTRPHRAIASYLSASPDAHDALAVVLNNTWNTSRAMPLVKTVMALIGYVAVCHRRVDGQLRGGAGAQHSFRPPTDGLKQPVFVQDGDQLKELVAGLLSEGASKTAAGGHFPAATRPLDSRDRGVGECSVWPALSEWALAHEVQEWGGSVG